MFPCLEGQSLLCLLVVTHPKKQPWSYVDAYRPRSKCLFVHFFLFLLLSTHEAELLLFQELA